MLNNLLKVHENLYWAIKNYEFFLYKVLYFKIYVIIASMTNRFEEAIALKCSDQMIKYVAVFASNT